MQDMLLILNFDSRYASTVAMKLRAERIDCRILPGDTPFEKVVAQGALGLVLAGGVTGEPPAQLDGRLLSGGIPVLGMGDAALRSSTSRMRSSIKVRPAMALQGPSPRGR